MEQSQAEASDWLRPDRGALYNASQPHFSAALALIAMDKLYNVSLAKGKSNSMAKNTRLGK